MDDETGHHRVCCVVVPWPDLTQGAKLGRVASEPLFKTRIMRATWAANRQDYKS